MRALPVFEYAPLEVKQAVVGNGKAEKKQVQLMVKALLDLPKVPHPADAADALAAAICHIHSSRLREILENPRPCGSPAEAWRYQGRSRADAAMDDRLAFGQASGARPRTISSSTSPASATRWRFPYHSQRIADPGERGVSLHIHTHVREDSLSLFGF